MIGFLLVGKLGGDTEVGGLVGGMGVKQEFSDGVDNLMTGWWHHVPLDSSRSALRATRSLVPLNETEVAAVARLDEVISEEAAA